mmetsp:Transcript_66151/g.187877  ORF Transcript_66151/g.187877 Transcript_66151/m.187877 type:complete len:331 (-) Transcript_66151:91-1083(-)
MLGITHSQYGVQAIILAHGLIEEEGGGDRRRICQACGLNDNTVQAAPTCPHVLHHLLHALDEITSQRAADASIIHLHNRLRGALSLLDKRGVDAHFPELVLNDGDPLAVLLPEDPVQEGRLAASQEAGDHRDRDLGILLPLAPLIVALLPGVVPRVRPLNALEHLRRPPFAATLQQLLRGVQLGEGAPGSVHFQQSLRSDQIAERPLPRPDPAASAGGVQDERAGAESPGLSKLAAGQHDLRRLKVCREGIARDRNRRYNLACQSLLLVGEPQNVARLRMPGHCRGATAKVSTLAHALDVRICIMAWPSQESERRDQFWLLSVPNRKSRR